MDQLVSDVRFALRLFAKNPVFTSASVIVLALGIGASTAIFSVVDNTLFRPLDMPDSERVVTLCETHASLRGWCGVSMPNLADWAESSRSFEAMGLARGWQFDLRTDDGLRGVRGGYASPGFFEALGYAAARGRLFQPGDLPPRGDSRMVLVSHGFWQREMGGAANAVGRVVVLEEEPYTVIGVLPEGADVPRLEGIELFAVLKWDPRAEEHRDWRGFVGIGRLAKGVTAEEAEMELELIQASLGQTHPEAVQGYGVDLHRLRDYLVRGARPVLMVFLAAVGVVLLIVCVNMAVLLLTRAAAREREIVVRSALGADGARIARQLLTESSLLALMGGALGILTAYWATDLFVAMAPPGLPRIEEVSVDGRILAFALVVTLASGLLFGMVPALRARGMEIAAALRDSRSVSSGRTTSRLRKTLVVVELALALSLVSGAGLLLRSFAGMLDWDPGFDTEHVLTFQIFANPGTYREDDDVRRLYRNLKARLEALPGVGSVGTVSAAPLLAYGGDGTLKFRIEGRGGDDEELPAVYWFEAGPDYFQTLGVPLQRGRGFSEADEEGAPPVALINQAMADRFWGDADPIGSRVHLPERDEVVEVVGVVADIPPFHPGDPVEPELYISNRQSTRWASYFLLRTVADPLASAGPAIAAVKEVDPQIQPASVLSIEQLIAGELSRPRFNMALVSLFAGVALILGLVGVYGVVAYSVELRHAEIGIRMALGAQRARVLRSVMVEGAALLLPGMVLGGLGAMVFARLLSGMLYGIRPTDPWALAATVLVVLGTGVMATILPARRASRIDPMRVLRAE